MRTTTHGRVLRALTSALLLAFLAALLLAGSALAGSKPGKPTAKAPKGTITTTKPAFKWSKAKGAAKYELRVSQGSKLLVKKTGLRKTTWTSSKALPTNVGLTWKVRASNARGVGAWSRRLEFTIAALAIGDPYGGGIVAYILQPGDPGYVAGQTHGLIAATADQTPAGGGIQWATASYWHTDVPGAHGLTLGDGAANTVAIITQNGGGVAVAVTYAAGLARAYAGGGYDDWYLPSKDELNRLNLNRAAIGGFHTAVSDWPYYWSSSQGAASASAAWGQGFFGGVVQGDIYFKDQSFRVRAVRAF